MAIQTEQLLLHPLDQEKIAAAVEAAERRTSVQFHVHIEATSRYPEARAHDLLRAALTRSPRRNSMVLYLLAHERRAFIVTDLALRPLESTRVWRDVLNRLMLDLLHGKLGDGMADAVGRFSHIVGGHFPGVVEIQPRSLAR
ncbi:MAG TPA: TPM domain-containing protein [Polyangia bacterium]|jgi:uncharacterized membrane protein